MTERERFLKTLRREEVPGLVPHFELVFYLTMEALGKVHPSHRFFEQWNQMSAAEQKLQMEDMADCYVEVARRYRHSAILLHPNPADFDSIVRILETVREKSDGEYCLMLHGDPTPAIPNGDEMMDFSVHMYEKPEAILRETAERTKKALERAYQLSKRKGLLDGFCLCSDYCFNINPFFSPDMFSVFVTPFLKEVITGYHEMGFCAIKHTDGNIMPIVDQMVACGPDALHSLDPQAGVDIGKLIGQYGDRVSFIGNVNCGLLQTGTDAECEHDIRRSLQEGMKAKGYVFSTSNCIYTGMPLQRYEMMQRIWREIGIR